MLGFHEAYLGDNVVALVANRAIVTAYLAPNAHDNDRVPRVLAETAFPAVPMARVIFESQSLAKTTQRHYQKIPHSHLSFEHNRNQLQLIDPSAQSTPPPPLH